VDPAGRGVLEQSLSDHLGVVNETLDPHEQLDCLVVVREVWSEENDLVTPTLKVKRNRIEAVYSQHYEGWVGARRPVLWQ
jgi:long-chain acyl-CoA synthetase